MALSARRGMLACWRLGLGNGAGVRAFAVACGKSALVAQAQATRRPLGRLAVAPAALAPAARRGFATALNCPELGGESIKEGTIMEWKAAVGDQVSKDDIIVVIETDKVTVDVKAETDGVLKEIAINVDDTVEVGQLLAKIEPGAAGASPTASPPAPAPEASAPAAAAPSPAPSGPAPVGLRANFARLAAKRLGLPEPAAAAVVPAAAAASPAPAASAVPAAISVGEGRNEYRVPVNPLRRSVMEAQKEAQQTAALLTTFQEADMSAVTKIQAKYKDIFEKKYGAELGLMAVMIKASSLALLEEPGVNAVIDSATNEIVYRDYVDIGVPVASPRGPVSCVLRNVEAMSVFDIARHMKDLQARARKDELTPDDLSDSTFGIQDTGPQGGMLGTNLISHMQSATLGTNAVVPRPIAVGNKVEARPVMYMSLTYDHRLVDGREAVTFLVSMRDKLEDPSRMVLGL